MTGFNYSLIIFASSLIVVDFLLQVWLENSVLNDRAFEYFKIK